MVDLGIVIVTYNVCDLLRKCLQSIFNSEGDISFAVCVVDNASSDESSGMVRKEFPEVDLISNKVNIGYPAANNLGLRRLGIEKPIDENQPRYCLLLNPDTEVPANAFLRMIEFLDQNPDVGIAGPKLVMPDGNLDLACRRSFPTPEVSFYRFTGLSRIFPRSTRFGRYNMTYLDENQMADVDSVVGAFMMLRTSAINQVGLMDERFWMYGEDLDWSKRIKDAGWRVVYFPEISVLHVKRASSQQSSRARIEFYRAMLIFYYKHYYQETPRLLHWMVLIGVALKGGRSVMSDVAAGQSILQSKQH